MTIPSFVNIALRDSLEYRRHKASIQGEPSAWLGGSSCGTSVLSLLPVVELR
jgi:hypothetical protein